MKRLLIGLALLATAVGAAAFEPQHSQSIITICRYDLTQFAKGDKTWLERKSAELSESSRTTLFLVCKAYGQGLVDGMAIAEEERRNAV